MTIHLEIQASMGSESWGQRTAREVQVIESLRCQIEPFGSNMLDNSEEQKVLTKRIKC